MSISSHQPSDVHVIMPKPPHGSPVPSRGSHRSMDDMSLSPPPSWVSSSNRPRHYSDDYLSISSDESSMSLFMERILDMKLDAEDGASISSKSCSSMPMAMSISSITSPASLSIKSGRKQPLLPPSSDANPKSIVTPDSTDKTWSQAVPNLDSAVLDPQALASLENEAIGLSYSEDGSNTVSPEEVELVVSSTPAGLPTTLVLVSGESAVSRQQARTFHQDRAMDTSQSPSFASADNPLDLHPELPHILHNQERFVPRAQRVPQEIMSDNLVYHSTQHVASLKPTPRFSPSPNDRIYIHASDITQDDVYCGREERGTNHPANTRYRNLVIAKRSIYQAFRSKERQKKTALSTRILDEEVKGRFVVNHDEELYYLMTRKEARKKVSQSLREK